MLPASALLALLSACSRPAADLGLFGDGPPPVLLAWHPETLVSLEVPQDSRDGVEPPEVVSIRGPWTLIRSDAGVHTFETPLPIRLRSLFFIHPPEGMTVEAAGEQLVFRAGQRGGGGTWNVTAHTLRVYLATDTPPTAGDVVLRYDAATQRERSLNRRWSEADSDLAFVFRSAWQDATSRRGLLLPAPARASWRLRIPPNGRLALDAGLLDPETADLDPSDGARLLVGVDDGAGLVRVVATGLEPGVFGPVSADLGRWSGQDVLLEVVTEPGRSSRSDYVFLGEPVLYTPVRDAPRVILLFVDTLRPDHMDLYGYPRDTMPRLTAWARSAAVFEDTHAVAPWTLPSSRAFLTGNQPESWGRVPTLPALLAGQGYSTSAFVGNVYLSANFDMDGDWGTHFVENWPLAEPQVDRILAWLDAHADRPVLSMVHFMDPHLPYKEPVQYRDLWAGMRPSNLREGFLRSETLSAARGVHGKVVRSYVQDRYDGSLRYLDDQLARILERTRPTDFVFFFSDHGEEFWDHGGFEHGHTLHEELLKVPLVVKGPRVQAGRIPSHASLLDLAPTILSLVGAPPIASMRGNDLGGLLLGKPDAAGEPPPRLLGLGWPLYGDEQWGVIDGSWKFTTRSGSHAVYDLSSDPTESRDLFESGEGRPRVPFLRESLAEALDRPVHRALRIRPDRVRSATDLVATLSVPGGVQVAWVGQDATMKSRAQVAWKGGEATAVWSAGYSGTREVFVVPAGDFEAALPGLVLTLRRGEDVREIVPDPERAEQDEVLLSGRIKGTRVTVLEAVGVEPPPQALALVGWDAETEGALRALGYLEDEDSPPSEP
ncbi:MAG: sulfatase [Deltaproteobacteria bacterium]|nr:sulfatase [Deltaproteobacteria bacterium]